MSIVLADTKNNSLYIRNINLTLPYLLTGDFGL